MCMRETAILTWCDNNGPTNYGQILQCYAMQQICKKLQLLPTVIYYREPGADEPDLTQLGSAERMAYERLYKEETVGEPVTQRVLKFRSFISEHIKVSKPCYTKQEVENITGQMDILLCGSDQIWNPLWFREVFALAFGKAQQRRISYAAGGIACEDEADGGFYKKLAEYLMHFDAISVREPISAEILRHYTEKPIVDVLDPTFLLTQEEWEDVAANRMVEEPYIFCYTLGRLRPYKHLLRKSMDKCGANRIVYIPSNLDGADYYNDSKYFKVYRDAGPAEFLSLIRHSEMVCTDSFHGMALSVNMRKQFCTIRRKQCDNERIASGERQRNILQKMHLTDRSVSCIRDIMELDSIDYAKVRPYYDREVAESWDFLHRALEQQM